jgi:predicted nucleic acid-binding protein
MAATKVFLDAGPLVGFVNATDQHHGWATEAWKGLNEPLWTCEAVLSEVVFLLASSGVSIRGMLELFDRRLVRIDFPFQNNRRCFRFVTQARGSTDEFG